MLKIIWEKSPCRNMDVKIVYILYEWRYEGRKARSERGRWGRVSRKIIKLDKTIMWDTGTFFKNEYAREQIIIAITTNEIASILSLSV